MKDNFNSKLSQYMYRYFLVGLGSMTDSDPGVETCQEKCAGIIKTVHAELRAKCQGR